MTWFKLCEPNWGRADWPQMLSKAFELMPHNTAGTFKPWSKMNYGRITFMNDERNISVAINTEIHWPIKIYATAIVSFRDTPNKNGYIQKEWKWEEFKRMPYDIVKGVYELIDKEDGNNGDDEETVPDYDPSESLNPSLVLSSKKFAEATGDCFAVAGKTQISIGGTLVHGMVTHPLTKQYYWHAWVEKDGMAIDNTIDLKVPVERYYEIFKAEPKARYNGLSWVGEKMYKSNHWGPWL